MNTIQIILISLVVIIHMYIVYIEMAVWTSEKAMNAFAIKTK
ncbi:DUF1304 family protein [Polaribacter sp. HaHaR_3_91]|nr:DUF1304 family protein [Polaribacter sp. HaHaR_3_91]